jgi:hypothetical protein
MNREGCSTSAVNNGGLFLTIGGAGDTTISRGALSGRQLRAYEPPAYVSRLQGIRPSVLFVWLGNAIKSNRFFIANHVK